MAISLGRHISLACLGVGMAALTLLAEWRGLLTGDEAYLVRRRRARAGVIAAAGIPVPRLFDGLTHRGLPVVILSALSGAVSLVLLLSRRYFAVPITATLAVGTLLWGWAVGQYPYLPGSDVTIAAGAATPPVLSATFTVLGIEALVLVPSPWWLFSSFPRPAERSVPVASDAVSRTRSRRGARDPRRRTARTGGRGGPELQRQLTARPVAVFRLVAVRAAKVP